jgi:putative nucleotidyltransferase with HDIG domain
MSAASLLTREQVMARLKQLPSLPSAVNDLMASFGDEDVDIERIAQQIARDQGLTARVLRVANSSFYGLQSKVGTIREAVVVLGFRAVRSMVLAVSMSAAFRAEQCPGFDPHAYLRHAAATALAARFLAPACGQNAELAFTGGLLHDIGQLVLAANFPTQYSAALAYRRQHDCQLLIAEREVLGLDHAVVGGLLAESWRFPDSLFSAVALHHDPASAEAASLADLVHLADITAHALGLTGNADEMVPVLDSRAWVRLGMDGDKFAQVLPHIVAAVDETCQALTG